MVEERMSESEMVSAFNSIFHLQDSLRCQKLVANMTVIDCREATLIRLVP